MPASNTASGEQIDRVNFMAKIAGFMLGTDRVFEKLGLPRVSFVEPRFQPSFVTLEQIAQERCLEKSGVEALRTFTDIWDGYCELMRTRGKHPFENVMEVAVGRLPFFSGSQLSLILESISEYQNWLNRHFPDACAYGYGAL